MPFRDDLEAAQARADALQRRVDELESENRRLRGEEPAESTALAPVRPPGRDPVPALWAVSSVGLGLLAAGLAVSQTAGALAFGILSAGTLAGAGFARLRVQGRSGWVAVLHSSGARARRKKPRYRVVPEGGYALRDPFQRIDWFDVRWRLASARIEGAHTSDGHRVSLGVSAFIRPAPLPPAVDTAVEGFIGRSADEVARSAANVIEGTTRTLLTDHTAGDLADRTGFLEVLAGAARRDLAALGLELADLSFRDLRVA